MDARLLLQKATLPVMVTMKGQARKEDVDVVQGAGIKPDDIITTAYREIAEQISRDERLKAIAPKNPIIERPVHEKRGDITITPITGGMSKTQQAYNHIHNAVNGLTCGELCEKMGLHASDYYIKVLRERGLIKENGKTKGQYGKWNAMSYIVTDPSVRLGETTTNADDLNAMFPPGTKTEVFR